MTPSKALALALLSGLLSALSPAVAAPFTPSTDAEVVERLPSTTNDPSVRRVDSLRKQLAARPDDVQLRLEIARRYFDMAMAQGDPRYVGYATAAIGPLDKLAPNDASFWLVRGLLEQYSHDFPNALKSLVKSSQLDPNAPEPVAWRAAIDMVQARYDDALGECTRLVPLADPIYAQGCTAYLKATTGHLKEAYDALSVDLASEKDVPPEARLWILTRLAEMSIRMQRPDEAEKNFKLALQSGVTDQFLLGAYSDFLLSQKRAGEVMTMLKDWERSDILLLRLALAGKMAGDSRAKGWADQLRDRFDAAMLRGDRLHEQEAARFELDVEGNAKKALDYASRNYTSQREPRDAEILLRSALAANNPKAAEPALDWLKLSGYEDPALASLAAQIATSGAKK